MKTILALTKLIYKLNYNDILWLYNNIYVIYIAVTTPNIINTKIEYWQHNFTIDYNYAILYSANNGNVI